MQIRGKYYSLGIQKIHESRCKRKETVDRDILITSGNSDGKVSQPMRKTSQEILPVHFFQRLLTSFK